MTYFSKHLPSDLIDTLWNVKFVAALSVCFPLFRFNRYIVECKASFISGRPAIDVRFNRYIVECKVDFREFDTQVFKGFNRYIVECKGTEKNAKRH